jgi:hypothetical protein
MDNVDHPTFSADDAITLRNFGSFIRLRRVIPSPVGTGIVPRRVKLKLKSNWIDILLIHIHGVLLFTPLCLSVLGAAFVVRMSLQLSCCLGG